MGSIPGLAQSTGERNGNPLLYSCLGNPMNRGAYVCYSSWGHKELDMTENMTDPVYNKTTVSLCFELDSRLAVYFKKHFTFLY